MPKKLEESTPEELIAQIRTLRKENADRRGAISTYDEAFAGLDPNMQRGLLRIVRVFADDKAKGAELFRQVADSILPPEGGGVQLEEEDDPMTNTNPLGTGDPPTGDPAGNQEMVALLEHVKKMEERLVQFEDERKNYLQADEDRQRNEAIAHLNELGYEQGTTEWDNIIRLASSDIFEGDLDHAHKMYDQFFPPVEGSGEGGEGQQQQEGGQQQEGQKTGQEGEEGAGAQFPATAGKSSVGGPKLDPNNGQEPDLSKAAVDGRARGYLENLMASQT